EKHRENIEKAAHVIACRIRFIVPVVVRLFHGYFGDAETLTFRQDRQEALLVTVQMNILENLAAHRACVATEIVKRQPGHEAQQAVKRAATNGLVPAGGARL